MSDQNERIGPKTILSHQKPSKHASPVWIFDVDFQFFHIKLQTMWTLNTANLEALGRVFEAGRVVKTTKSI